MAKKSKIPRILSAAGDEQESNGRQRANDIHVKRDPRVSRREIADHDHLSHMPNGITQQEDGRSANRPRLEAQVAPKCDAGCNRQWRSQPCQPRIGMGSLASQ